MSTTILKGDCRIVLPTLPDESVHCVVTSPPYFGLRDYGCAGQIGLETSPDEYVDELVGVFREVRRVLRSDGTLWLNLGDSYANDGKWGGHTGGKHVKALHCSPIGRNKRYTGLKPKDLIGIPWMVAFALRADGWWLRSDILWSKPNPMPESVTDRCTKSHEYLFMLSKSASYYYDADSIKEAAIAETEHDLTGTGFWAPGQTPQTGNRRKMISGSRRTRAVPPRHATYESSDRSSLNQVDRGMLRNKRSVWEVATSPFPDAHFATFPPALIEPCIMAGCPLGGTVLDPFFGAGTTAMVADRLGRNSVGIELNPEYATMAERRIKSDAGMFAEVK